MAEVSKIITPSEKYYVEGSVDDIITQLQKVNAKTQKLSKWFACYRLNSEAILPQFQSSDGVYTIVEETAINKSSIQSIECVSSNASIVTKDKYRQLNNEYRKETFGY